MSTAQIVKVCVNRQPLPACWNNAGVLTPIIAHYPYDGDGNPLPIGNTGSDGTTLIEPLYTDSQGAPIPGLDPADVTIGPCNALTTCGSGQRCDYSSTSGLSRGEIFSNGSTFDGATIDGVVVPATIAWNTTTDPTGATFIAAIEAWLLANTDATAVSVTVQNPAPALALDYSITNTSNVVADILTSNVASPEALTQSNCVGENLPVLRVTSCDNDKQQLCDGTEGYRVEPTKFSFNYYELNLGADTGLRQRDWNTTESTSANNLALGQQLRTTWDTTQTPASDLIVNSLRLNDVNNTAGVIDVQLLEGYIVATESVLARYGGGSEGYWAVELGQCCGPLELLFEFATTNTNGPPFTIPQGIHYFRGWNIDVGGSNSSKSFEYSLDGGATWTTNNTPPQIQMAQSKPVWDCKLGVMCGGQYFAADGATAITLSDTLTLCEPSCEASSSSGGDGGSGDGITEAQLCPAPSTETIVHGQNNSVPVGLKSVTINNVTGITTVDGVFELGNNRRLDSITYDASSHSNCFDGRLPEIALAGGTWQWTGIQ